MVHIIWCIRIPPTVTYKCTINVPGYPSSCKEAKSKKDAQTLAAWDFSETLVSMGKIGRGDLPHKPECVGMFNYPVTNILFF